MIHVFFVPGMFGSTIEYILRSFSNELDAVQGEVLADGSMHSFKKLEHWLSITHIESFFNSENANVDITTPIYPFNELHLLDILTKFNSYADEKDSCVLMYAESVNDAELNMLFQYHKISVGLNAGLDIFCGNNQHNITAWDPAYTHWKQMQPWQLREWFSLFYVLWVQEWIDSQQQAPSNFLCARNTDFLVDPVTISNKLFAHCNLTQKPGLEKFLQKWQTAQTYIIDEFELLDNIITSTANNQQLNWKPINIIAEAIVQQRLRALGYEIQCDGLNTFPTDSETLYNLLEKV
jgi:hypothetical protein